MPTPFIGRKNERQLLDRVYLFDPLLGFVNLIVSLRIGLYHDQLHYKDVIRMAEGFKASAERKGS
jgi:hypothetical protein